MSYNDNYGSGSSGRNDSYNHDDEEKRRRGYQ